MGKRRLIITMLGAAVLVLTMIFSLQTAFAADITAVYKSAEGVLSTTLEALEPWEFYTWRPTIAQGDTLTITEDGVETEYVYDSCPYKDNPRNVSGFYDNDGNPLSDRFRCKQTTFEGRLLSFYPAFEWIDEAPTKSGQYAYYRFLLYEKDAPDDAEPIAKTSPVEIYVEPMCELDGIRYRLEEDGTARVDRYTDYARTDFEIQATVTMDDGNEYPVRSIGTDDLGGGFLNCYKLESVIIPEGITNIRTTAFLGTTNMKEVTIPSSVKTIGKYALGYDGMYSIFTGGVEIEGKIPGFVIYAKAGTEGARYAKENGFDYIDLEAQAREAAAEEAYEKAKAEAKAKYTPAKVTITSLAAGKQKMTVKWKKISKATGYKVRYSRDKNFKTGVKTKKVTTYSKKGLTIKSLKKNKRWYVQVRAYRTVGGKTYYGPWSIKKSVKVK